MYAKLQLHQSYFVALLWSKMVFWSVHSKFSRQVFILCWLIREIKTTVSSNCALHQALSIYNCTRRPGPGPQKIILPPYCYFLSQCNVQHCHNWHEWLIADVQHILILNHEYLSEILIPSIHQGLSSCSTIAVIFVPRNYVQQTLSDFARLKKCGWC